MLAHKQQPNENANAIAANDTNQRTYRSEQLCVFGSISRRSFCRRDSLPLPTASLVVRLGVSEQVFASVLFRHAPILCASLCSVGAVRACDFRFQHTLPLFPFEKAAPKVAPQLTLASSRMQSDSNEGQGCGAARFRRSHGRGGGSIQQASELLRIIVSEAPHSSRLLVVAARASCWQMLGPIQPICSALRFFHHYFFFSSDCFSASDQIKVLSASKMSFRLAHIGRAIEPTASKRTI